MPQFRIETDQGNFLIDADRAPTPEEAQAAIMDLRGSGGPALGTLADAAAPERTWGQAIAGTAIRVGGAVAGGVAGSAVGMPVAGAMAGAGLGDVAARYATGEPQDLPESALQAGLAGLVPAGMPGVGAAAGVAKRALYGAVEGGLQGAVQTGAHSVITTGEAPPADELAVGTGFGAGLGALGHAVFGKVRGPATPNEEIEHAAGHRIVGETDVSPPIPIEGSAIEPPMSTFPEAPPTETLPAEIPPQEPAPKERVARMIERVPDTFPTAPPEVHAVLQAVIEENPDAFEAQTRGRQPIARIEGNATTIAIDPELTVEPGSTVNSEQYAAHRAFAEVTAANVVNATEAARQNPGDRGLQAGVLKAWETAVNVNMALRGYLSESARVLGYESHLKRTLSPEAQRQARLTEFAQGIREGVTPKEVAEAVATAGDDPDRIYQAILSLAKPTWPQWFRSFYLVNLMTTLGGPERNGLGNVITLSRDLATKPVAAGIDKGLSTLFPTRERTTYAGETPAMLGGGIKAFPDAIRAFTQVMARGFTHEDAVKLVDGTGYKGELRPFAPAPGPYKYVSRLYQGTDRFFRMLLIGMHTDAAVIAEATKRAGPKATKREIAALAADLKRAPEQVPGLLEAVDTIADRSLLQEQEAGKLHNAARAVGAVPFVGPMTLPFVNVGANMTRQGMQGSPAGIFFKATYQGGREGTQRAAETALGSILMGGLVWMAAEGRLTGTAPSDEGQKREFLAKHPENSAKIGDKWYRTPDLGVLNVPVSAAANFVEEFKRTGKTPTENDAVALVEHVFIGTAKTGASLLDASIWQSLADFFDAAKDKTGEKWGNYIPRRLVSLVPGQGLLRAVTNTRDPYVRQSTTLTERVKGMIPGRSTEVMPRLDEWGQPLRKDASGNESLLIDVPGVHGGETVKADPVREELSKYGIRPIPARRVNSYKSGTITIPLTPDADFALRQAKGWLRRSKLEKKVASEYYRTASPESQERQLHQAMEQGQPDLIARAKAKLRRGLPFTAEEIVEPSDRPR